MTAVHKEWRTLQPVANRFTVATTLDRERIHTQVEQGLDGTDNALDLNAEPFQILMIGICDKRGNAFIVFSGVERLLPLQKRALTLDSKLKRQEEVMAREVFDRNALVRHYAYKMTFIRIVLSVWAVHG